MSDAGVGRVGGDMPNADLVRGSMRLSDVNKAYGDNPVLTDINVEIPAGRVTTLMGRSGSGKTTLCRVLAGLVKPDSGSIWYDDIPIEKYEPNGVSVISEHRRRLRRNIGMVFQQYTLFPNMSLLDNVMLAPTKVLGRDRAAALKDAESALRAVSLWDKRDSPPLKLSGGQRQRGAIARELAMDREVLIFDEPTSALDPSLTHEVLDAMTSISEKGLTMVVITHELGFAARTAQKVIFMDRARVHLEADSWSEFEHSDDPVVREFLASS